MQAAGLYRMVVTGVDSGGVVSNVYCGLVRISICRAVALSYVLQRSRVAQAEWNVKHVNVVVHSQMNRVLAGPQ